MEEEVPPPWTTPPPIVDQTSNVDEFVEALRSLQQSHGLTDVQLKSYFIWGAQKEIMSNMSVSTCSLSLEKMVESARRIDEVKQQDTHFIAATGNDVVQALDMEAHNLLTPIHRIDDLGSKATLNIDLIRDNREIVKNRLRRNGWDSFDHLVDEVASLDVEIDRDEQDLHTWRTKIESCEREIAILEGMIAKKQVFCAQLEDVISTKESIKHQNISLLEAKLENLIKMCSGEMPKCSIS